MTLKEFKTPIMVIGIPVAFAFVFRFAFGFSGLESLWSIMTLTFFMSLPYGVGVLTIYLSSSDKAKSKRYLIFCPWIPIFIFLIVTLVFAIEGWACWIMVFPIFLFFASLGGLTCGYFKLKKSKRTNNLHISAVIILPFFIGPIEKGIGDIPGFYRADTSIDINASKEKIWSNVTSVKEIQPDEDRGRLTNFLQLPRPIRAELNYEGVGAKRAAIFSGGLVFDETVLKYEHEKMMNFSIHANPYEIPSTTFDEHIVVGGAFFNVLEGTYILEQISSDQYRLHLYSEFKLTTTFNFYASLWGKWIMQDIQENILQVIKRRSECKDAR